jgi:quercetin dioxygenase-like cupin family protein
MLIEHQMKKGWVGERHSHPHEQLVYVVTGHIRGKVGAQTFEAREGDSFVVVGGMEHEVTALADSVIVDVFTPARDEYLG